MNVLMMMAWRNVWRNRIRAAILLSAMAMGLIGILVTRGLTRGWLDEMIRYAVETYDGHVKITAPGYHANPVVDHCLSLDPKLYEFLDRDPRIRGWANRVAAQGLLSTPSQSNIVQIVGIDPRQERTVSFIADSVCEGAFLSAHEPRGVLVGKRLANKLKLGIGKKIVLMASARDGEMGSGAFRIGGVFDTGNGAFDESTVYILLPAAQELFHLDDHVTETVVLVTNIAEDAAVAAAIKLAAGNRGMDVLTWEERLPFIVETIRLSAKTMIVYYAMFFVAMAFGIVNALLMAIGERTHEIGIMMAVGMSRAQLIGLIVVEAWLIGILAVLFGCGFGYLVVWWLRLDGIDLGALTEATLNMGVGRMLYPRLDGPSIVLAAVATLMVAILCSLYPARRASRLAPAEAIRTTG